MNTSYPCTLWILLYQSIMSILLHEEEKYTFRLSDIAYFNWKVTSKYMFKMLWCRQLNKEHLVRVQSLNTELKFGCENIVKIFRSVNCWELPLSGACGQPSGKWDSPANMSGQLASLLPATPTQTGQTSYSPYQTQTSSWKKHKTGISRDLFGLSVPSRSDFNDKR